MSELSNGTGSGGEFIKVEDYKDAKAVLIEPTKVLRNQPGKWGERDILVADFTIFMSVAALEGEIAPTIIQSGKLDKKWMVADLADFIDRGSVCKFVAQPNKNGDKPIWVTRAVDQAVFERVAAYVESREASLLAAMEEEPEWMK